MTTLAPGRRVAILPRTPATPCAGDIGVVERVKEGEDAFPVVVRFERKRWGEQFDTVTLAYAMDEVEEVN